MNPIRKRLFLTAFTLIAISQIQAAVLTGHVRDAKNGEAIGAALVVNKTGGNTVLSGDDGSYSIQVGKLPVTLLVRFIGYVPKEFVVKKVDDPQLEVQLEPTGKQTLDEVVVVGYGTQKRTQLTGSVTKVNAEVFDNFRTPTLDQALGGAVSGVDVTTGGQPGSGSQIRIRGGNSVNASNNPLYVIDGFIYYNDESAFKTGIGGIESSLDPLSFINPSDIQSLEVLKDVSATAIYGSRGANGVVIITTKKGAREGGLNTVRYSASATLSTPSKKLDVLNATQWAQMDRTYFNNRGRWTDESIAALGKGTNWQDAVLKSAWSQRHEISFSGGDAKTRYLLSAGYTDQNGVVLNSDFKRYNLRANLERELSKKFNLTTVITVGKTTQNSLSTTQPANNKTSPYNAGITNSLTYALFMPPVVPIYNADGSYNYTNPYENSFFSMGDQSVNPVSDLKNTTAESINRYALANVSLDYKVTNDLVAKFSAGADFNNLKQNYFAPSYTALGLNEHGVGSIGNKEQEATQAELTLTYNKQLNKNNFLNALAGYTYQHTKTNYNTTTTSHFTNETLGHNNLGDGSQVYTPVSGQSKSNLNSLIARVNYTLLERYNATATLRADHSSRFAKNHRWGWFPSLGLSWNINRERFIPEGGVVSNLKLRASYGVVGNQEIGDYEYTTTYSAASYGGSTVYLKSNLGNDDLKWETTSQFNIGADAGFFDNRLNFVADLYYKKTSDLLLTVPVNSSTGTGSQLRNIGNVTNKGLELAVSGTPVLTKQLQWNVSANITFNKNELTKMGNGLTQLTSGEHTEYILKEGEAVGSFYGLIFDGVNPETGEARFRDVSGPDGVPDGKINSYDRVVLGSCQPDFFYGIHSTLKYRAWDFAISFKGSQGAKNFNSLRRSLEMPTGYNVLTSVLNAWTPENTNTSVPRISGSYQTSYIDSRYVESASFLKLQNITIGYTFKLPKVVQSIRAYVSGQNLFTITGYKGYDPEVAEGRDLGAYPAARNFIFGVDITF